MKRRDEFGLIRLLTGGQQTPDTLASRLVVGNGDDAAVMSGRTGYDWIACCDTMVEHVHFARRTMRPFDIGHKALAANISDIAAMGGIPLFYLVSLGLPASFEEAEIVEIYEGMSRLAATYHMALVGGDTVAIPGDGPLTITVTVLGEVETGRSLTRAAAKPGDRIFVTGPVGSSGAGLHALLACGIDELPERWQTIAEAHRLPMPQVTAGRVLGESGARIALNDVSDGLASEAWEIAEASRATLVLTEDTIPIADDVVAYAAATGLHAQEWTLYGGEDYQLIGCAPPDEQERLTRAFQDAGLSLHWIGYVTEGLEQVRIRRASGEEALLAKKGYNHFQ
ncbi:thiamine-monophosphate kinase [Aneurinibacillus soli]|uniref:Thiamine-monophosphate kinase n=1 Tax=Aneurinibacillus soli TaxID=1500254 RepID=A0A0U5BE74_9BACL|nr:thiamine-phosphate kinase [Aneurinibacillus soli]PYE60584.1 thiamine-monophosphate kinase [Aneurinibacillus soli]BAU29894.1 Thiamine-monophosphate kinase [Aneurinibacillus soli]